MPAVLPNWQGQYEVPQDIQSWKGSIFSIFSKHAANWNGSGYGPLLMTPAVSYPHLCPHHALHSGSGFPLHHGYNVKWSTSGKSSAGDSERLFKVSEGDVQPAGIKAAQSAASSMGVARESHS